MANLLDDPKLLRMRLDKLLELRKSGESDSIAIEALAECCFRLAVHPSTPLTESLDLLYKAVRYDGTNPKHAYHLARLYFKHGKLEHASSWLQLASRLCPVSHRIWCHISLLQKELSEKYKEAIKEEAKQKDGDKRREETKSKEEKKTRIDADGLRKRSDTLAKAIAQGTDEIDPVLLNLQPPVVQEAKSNKTANQGKEGDQKAAEDPSQEAKAPARLLRVRRLGRPGACRWSGVHDLLAEDLLHGELNKFSLRGADPLLKAVAGLMHTSSSGQSRFAILAIEWILSGYPIKHILELRAAIPSNVSSRSLELLDLVCEMYKMEPDCLPAMISEALEGGRIPPILAALIHQRRLLWYPSEFRKTGTSRAARRFLSETACEASTDEETARTQVRKAREYTSSLKSALRALAEKQSRRPAGIQPEREVLVITDLASALEHFSKVDDASGKLIALSRAASEWLKADLYPRATALADNGAYSLAAADRKALDEFANVLRAACEAGLKRVKSVIESIEKMGNVELPTDFPPRRDGCEKAFTDLKKDPLKGLKQIDKALQTVSERFEASQCAPSQRVCELLTEVREPASACGVLTPEQEVDIEQQDDPSLEAPAAADEIESQDDSPDDRASTVEDMAEDNETGEPTHLFNLRRAIQDVDRWVEDTFRQANGTFDAYSPRARTLPAIHALRATVRASQAEILYRMGRRGEARRIWGGMLVEDRTNDRILNNIAVCDTGDSDLGRCLLSWRSYAEILYFYGIVACSPRLQAARRASFHRSFGNAYAPAFLFAELDNKWADKVDDQAMLSFLASPGRVRSFVNHKMLEFLNSGANCRIGMNKGF